MANVIDVMKTIRADAEKIHSDRTQQFPEAASPGDKWRQGDIYIELLDAVPTSFSPAKCERQLAPGTSKGSRHILDREVEMFVAPHADALTGPVFKTAGATVTHPEHGDVELPAGIYRITYQRAYADELRRVRD